MLLLLLLLMLLLLILLHLILEVYTVSLSTTLLLRWFLERS